MLKFKKLTENSNFSDSSIFSVQYDAQKQWNRQQVIDRIINTMAKAIDKLQDQGQDAKAKELEIYLQHLQRWVDSTWQDLPEEPPEKTTPGEDKAYKPSIQEITQTLKSLTGKSREDAKRALQDIYNSLKGTNNLTEALIPVPEDKTLMELSDSEFTKLVNSIYDELNEILNLPMRDQEKREVRVNEIKKDNDSSFAQRELEQEDNLNLKTSSKSSQINRPVKENGHHFASFGACLVDISRAMKAQIKEYEVQSDSPIMINRRAEDEKIIKKGEITDTRRSRDIPSIDLYFDRSGSWTSDKWAINAGKEVENNLKKLKDAGKIDLTVWYFSDDITQDEKDPMLGMGTDAWSKIIKNIKENNTKNVVLMTDADMCWAARRDTTCVVDGCVWIIWNGMAANAIADKLVGRQGSLQYSLQSDPIDVID